MVCTSDQDLQRSPQVLRGVCDGDLVLDSRDWSIVEDASCLERLLKCNWLQWVQSVMDWSTKNQSPQWLSRNGWYINYPESEVWVYHKFKSWKNSHGCQLMSNTPIIDPAWQIRVAPGLHKRGQHILGTIRAASQPQKLRICHNVEGFDFRGGQSPRGTQGWLQVIRLWVKRISSTSFWMSRAERILCASWVPGWWIAAPESIVIHMLSSYHPISSHCPHHYPI